MRFVETTSKDGERLTVTVVDIPDGKYCPVCGRPAGTHVPMWWVDRLRVLKRYVASGKVVFKSEVARELSYLRRELRWVVINRWQESRDNREWERALAWVRADRAAVEAELLDTVSRQIPPRHDETEEDYVARLRAYRATLSRLGESVDAFPLRDHRRNTRGGENT